MGTIFCCLKRDKDNNNNIFLNCSNERKKNYNNEPEITIKTINKIYGKDYIKNYNIK